MYVFSSGRGKRCGGELMRRLDLELPILYKQGECGMCVCVWVAVVWVVLRAMGGWLGPSSWRVVLCLSVL